MNEKKVQDMQLLSKADAAFRQAAKKIIQRARQTHTPVVVWEEGHIKEISGEEFTKWSRVTPKLADTAKETVIICANYGLKTAFSGLKTCF